MEVPDDIAVAPLSGGFDSRLLCSMVPEPKRLATFTYGISQNQEESFEVQIAANVARLNGNEWAHIPQNITIVSFINGGLFMEYHVTFMECTIWNFTMASSVMYQEQNVYFLV